MIAAAAEEEREEEGGRRRPSARAQWSSASSSRASRGFSPFFPPVLIFSRSHSRLPSRSKRRRRRPKERRRRQQERERQETHRTSFDPLQPLLLPLSAPRTEGNTPSEAQARTEESEQRRRASVAVFPSSLLRRNRPSQNSIKERVSKFSSSSFLFPFSAPLREQMDEARLRGLRVETQVQPGRTGTGRREREERRKRRKGIEKRERGLD